MKPLTLPERLLLERFNPTGAPVGGGAGMPNVIIDGDIIAKTTAEFVAALKSAKPGQTVFIPGDAALNLTNHDKLTIRAANVTIASDRGCKGSQGARLYVTKANNALLYLTKQATLSGLRLEGPHKSVGKPKQAISRGVWTRNQLTIRNCEVSGFGHAGVYGQGTTKAIASVDVEHCHIHHCQRIGYGYGVLLNGGEATVKVCHLEYNRHHIAAVGLPDDAYRARYNVCGGENVSHAFDMHGDKDRRLKTSGAGRRVIIDNNIFLDDGRHHGKPGRYNAAVVVRGVPATISAVCVNVFQHADPDRAVRQTDGGKSGAPKITGNLDAYDNILLGNARLTMRDIAVLLSPRATLYEVSQ